MSSIVIYDSGVGGLSVYQAIAEKCPQHDYVFVSDNAAFPYGTKSEPELIARVTQVVERIAEHYAPEILVIACNTASTVVLPILREKFAFDIVGVVPAIKPAAKVSKSGYIGLLATPATIQRDYTDRLISEFASDCKVVRVGSTELVEMAEQKLRGQAPDLSIMSAVLAPFLKYEKLDCLILACTHFPLLSKEIESFFEENSVPLKLLDSSAGIANRVDQLSTCIDGSVSIAIAAFTETLNEPGLFACLAELGFTDIEMLVV